MKPEANQTGRNLKDLKNREKRSTGRRTSEIGGRVDWNISGVQQRGYQGRRTERYRGSESLTRSAAKETGSIQGDKFMPLKAGGKE